MQIRIARVRSRKREKEGKEELASAVHTCFDKLFHCRLFLVRRRPALLVEDNEGILESLHTEAVGVVSRASALFSEGGEREGGREGGREASKARFTICHIASSRRPALPRREDRIHFYLRGRTRRGNACEHVLGVLCVVDLFVVPLPLYPTVYTRTIMCMPAAYIVHTQMTSETCGHVGV